MKPILAALFVIIFSACVFTPPSPIPGMDYALSQLSSAPVSHPASSCTFCADVYGKNYVKKLCPDSKIAWDDMVKAICETKCKAPCTLDWCAQLDNVGYVSATGACYTCAIDYCMPEILACSAAQ